MHCFFTYLADDFPLAENLRQVLSSQDISQRGCGQETGGMAGKIFQNLKDDWFPI